MSTRIMSLHLLQYFYQSGTTLAYQLCYENILVNIIFYIMPYGIPSLNCFKYSQLFHQIICCQLRLCHNICYNFCVKSGTTLQYYWQYSFQPPFLILLEKFNLFHIFVPSFTWMVISTIEFRDDFIQILFEKFNIFHILSQVSR